MTVVENKRQPRRRNDQQLPVGRTESSVAIGLTRLSPELRGTASFMRDLWQQSITMDIRQALDVPDRNCENRESTADESNSRASQNRWECAPS